MRTSVSGTHSRMPETPPPAALGWSYSGLRLLLVIAVIFILVIFVIFIIFMHLMAIGGLSLITQPPTIKKS
ncbi:MAG: hypothetical protein QX196_13120 [Methylococcaceae bacterium]